MQELLIMIGLSILLAVAAFAHVPDSNAQGGRGYPTSSDARLSSVPRDFTASSLTDVPTVPFMPNQGTATFLDTTTQFSAAPERENEAPVRAASISTTTGTSTKTHTGTGAIPSEPPGMPERRSKPSGFR